MAINQNAFVKRRIVIVSIALFIGALHLFRAGSYLPDDIYKVYRSYFSDIFIPIAFYFLLCALEFMMPQMKSWKVKLAVTFLLPSFAETCQAFGIPLLGSTFDPLDYLMYGIGAASACLIETQLFPKVFKFWLKENSFTNGNM